MEATGNNIVESSIRFSHDSWECMLSITYPGGEPGYKTPCGIGSAYFGMELPDLPDAVQASVTVNASAFREALELYAQQVQGGEPLYFYHPDLCANRAQNQARLSYAEMKQSARSNHLGSASWVTDCSGKASFITFRQSTGVPFLLHTTDPHDAKIGSPLVLRTNSAFGEPFVNQQSCLSIRQMKKDVAATHRAPPRAPQELVPFTGKDPHKGWRTPLNKIIYSEQRDEETGYSYHGARYYDPSLSGIWLSVDPMADKYPSISPYAYCAWNPVKLVDPDGMDEWEMSATGKVKKIANNNESDIVYSLNSKGKRVNSKSFKYGTIEKLSSGKVNNHNFQVLRVRGDENGEKLFEFLADPSNFELMPGQNVEWARILVGESGNSGLNYLTTSWEKETNAGLSILFKKQLKYGYTIRGIDHNHPTNNKYPSGTGDSNGDIPFIKMLKKMGVNLTPNAKYRIYTPGNNIKYNYYDENSKMELNTIIVQARKNKH